MIRLVIYVSDQPSTRFLLPPKTISLQEMFVRAKVLPLAITPMEHATHLLVDATSAVYQFEICIILDLVCEVRCLWMRSESVFRCVALCQVLYQVKSVTLTLEFLLAQII